MNIHIKWTEQVTWDHQVSLLQIYYLFKKFCFQSFWHLELWVKRHRSLGWQAWHPRTDPVLGTSCWPDTILMSPGLRPLLSDGGRGLVTDLLAGTRFCRALISEGKYPCLFWGHGNLVAWLNGGQQGGQGWGGTWRGGSCRSQTRDTEGVRSGGPRCLLSLARVSDGSGWQTAGLRGEGTPSSSTGWSPGLWESVRRRSQSPYLVALRAR